MLDFDKLVAIAFDERPGELEPQDDLWKAVFSLDKWHFILRKTDGHIHPYVAEAQQIEPGTYWLYAFTEAERCTQFEKLTGLTNPVKTGVAMEVPVNDALIPWVESFSQYDVKGIYFNADTRGFYAPLHNLARIKEHLDSQ